MLGEDTEFFLAENSDEVLRIIESEKQGGTQDFMVSLTTSKAAFATGATAKPTDEPVDFSGVTNPIVRLLNSLITPLMALVGAGGAIFCIFLGVKYATAEEPQEREKRKQSLKTAIIGFVLIFVLIVALRLSLPILTEWMTDSTKK